MRVACAAALIFTGALFGAGATAAVTDKIEFNRDVRPILSDKCFRCHGPDPSTREARLRLDVRENALAREAFVPGKPAESELVIRILSQDPDEMMPPPDSHKKLSPQEKIVLQRWIEQGAGYQRHWAYEPPVKAAILAGANGVDVLVRRRLAEIGLASSPEADRRTLIRRLSFDLLGLPPAPEEVTAFENDASPNAYERLVERLLASPHYGERMAIPWLDVVRFADTVGYHSDVPRNVWPYRDWVIRSFNENKRFDRFTLEQIAGDLLPDATRETRVGSAFNRLLLTTEEGGAQPKDYEQRMLADRVRAIGTVWLGQTTGCAQCHDHKFDPFTTRDFYSLGAFFADIKEAPVGKREDGLSLATPEQERQLATLREAVTKAQGKLDAVMPAIDAAQATWEADVRAGRVVLKVPAPAETADDDDAEAKANDRKLAADVARTLTGGPTKPGAKEKRTVQAYFRAKVNTLFPVERVALADAEQAYKAFEDTMPKCLVSESSPTKRTVRILPRGNWMDESGPIVVAALPAYLPRKGFEERELTRLDLAHWLVSRENPLTARTFVNRLWQQFFGAGLSRVLSDLGAQGEPPSNGPLLDWLACEFMDSGWDVKHIVRLIVSSATYRQTSEAGAVALAADPENREHARQSRFRLEAELVRDNALAVAGLLSPAIGGPSVKPYQPEHYWENLNFPKREYVADHGEPQYRRGLYVWWQRTFLHPSLLAFDAPGREECAAERARSNLPQQALVLLNDPTYVEAARSFAARILGEGGDTVSRRLDWAWRRALQRGPRDEEARLMASLAAEHLAIYRADARAAEALLAVGDAKPPVGIDRAELAAWTHVARVLLSLHEFVTRS